MKRQKWTESELELTLAFYLFDKTNSDATFYLSIFSKDLEKYTKNQRNPSTIGLRVANYHFYDASFKGKGLFGGGKAAKGVFEKYTNQENFNQLKKHYLDFINLHVDEKNKKYYPNEQTILSTSVPLIKVTSSSNLIDDTTFEDRQVQKFNDQILILSPRKFEDKAVSLKVQKKSTKNYYERSPQVAINAIANSNYSCEIDSLHKTFTRKSKNEPYLEPHHLIPLSKQNDFQYSLDVEANIISLCSNCHNEIHYGQNHKMLIKFLYNKRIQRLEKTALKIDLATLIGYY
jgi:hypothetical protein